MILEVTEVDIDAARVSLSQIVVFGCRVMPYPRVECSLIFHPQHTSAAAKAQRSSSFQVIQFLLLLSVVLSPLVLSSSLNGRNKSRPSRECELEGNRRRYIPSTVLIHKQKLAISPQRILSGDGELHTLPEMPTFLVRLDILAG